MSVLAFVKETFSPMHIHQSIPVEISSPLYGLNPPKHSKTTIRHRHNSKMVENWNPVLARLVQSDIWDKSHLVGIMVTYCTKQNCVQFSIII